MSAVVGVEHNAIWKKKTCTTKLEICIFPKAVVRKLLDLFSDGKIRPFWPNEASMLYLAKRG